MKRFCVGPFKSVPPSLTGALGTRSCNAEYGCATEHAYCCSQGGGADRERTPVTRCRSDALLELDTQTGSGRI
jgi:hypothetical protein